MIVSTNLPDEVRAGSLAELSRLELPLPPENFPLVWDDGDAVEVRTRAELEDRAAILNVVLAYTFGMPAEAAVAWLDEAGLIGGLTAPERAYLYDGEGSHASFALHSEALAALGWLLSMIGRLDPAAPGAANVLPFFPNLADAESYRDWRARALGAPRHPREAAAALDLYYCLDWAYLTAEGSGTPLPGVIDSNAIGQRRWALEWAVVFHGPHHEPPPHWEEVDLST